MLFYGCHACSSLLPVPCSTVLKNQRKVLSNATAKPPVGKHFFRRLPQ
ncbi:hypothetical protein P3T33_002266 [Rhizobium sp. AN67]|nr:hypothetical protein [Rhizobium sp. AN67]